MILLKYISPVVFVALALCLVIQQNYLAKQQILTDSINMLTVQRDNLVKENKALYKENFRLNSLKEQHIKLDVTGVSHKGGGVVVNNSMCK